MATKSIVSRAHPSPRQLAARAVFAAAAKNRARSRPQGGVSEHSNPQSPVSRDRSDNVPNIITSRIQGMHVIGTTANATQPNTGAAGTPLTGDSLTTRNYRDPAIVAAWSSRQTSGFSQIAFPTGHDTTRGYRAHIPSGATEMTLPRGMQIPLTPQEVISNTISGSNTAGDIEIDCFLTRYSQDQGQRWMRWEEVTRRMREITTIQATIAGVATGQYGTAELITSESDLLLANRDYALIGISSNVRVACTGIIGPDTGNDRLIVPGNIRAELTNNFFANYLGACPVINSGNRAATNLFVAQDENNVSPTIYAVFALLA